jgi:hypothetical protein
VLVVLLLEVNLFPWRTPPCCRPGQRIHYKDSPWMTIDIPYSTHIAHI